MSEELQMCLDEAVEHLDACDRAAMALDQAASAGEEPSAVAVAELFRGVHTIKGNAGMLGLETLVGIAHALETLLDRLRAGQVAVGRDLVDVVFGGLDALRTETLARRNGVPSGLDHRAIAATILAALADGPTATERGWADRFPGWRLVSGAEAPIAAALAEGRQQLYRLEFALPAAAAAEPLAHPAVEKMLALGSAAAWCRGEGDRWWLAWASAADAETVGRFAPDELAACEPRPDGRMPAAPADAPAREATAGLAGGLPADAGEGTIRVGVALLDTLMTLVGELVLTRNQVLQAAELVAGSGLQPPVQRLSQLTTELQEAVMRTRMQPVGQVFEKLPRLVRDYCRQSGKEIELVQEGAETELDKGLLERIRGPLTHLVRNALDHGVEPPAARLAAGKPAAGTIRLAAMQEGGTVIVEVSDDGRGLDYDRIRAKALVTGIVPVETLARMNEAELAQLVFHAGFSTAEAVTDVSGRGVGMDVVKTDVERAGGSVELRSEPGRGTTTRLKIPLTLAVIPAIVAWVDGQRFAMPQAAIHEVVRPGEGGASLALVRDARVLRLRDELLPVVDLRTVLGMTAAGGGDPYLVVVHLGGRAIALAVNAVGDPEEIVVKPLPAFVNAVSTYAGVTILGDGTPCLILDVTGLASRAGLAAEPAGEAQQAASAGPIAEEVAREKMLVVAIAGRRYAVPMGLVTRLEDVPGERLEAVGNRAVLQYGERLLPVIDPAPLLGGVPAAAPHGGERQPLVVVGEGAAAVGLRVDAIHDVDADRRAMQAAPGVPGVLGTIVLGGRVIEVLDVPAALASVLGPASAGRVESQEEAPCP